MNILFFVKKNVVNKLKRIKKRTVKCILATVVLFFIYLFFGRKKVIIEGNKIYRSKVGGSDRKYEIYVEANKESIPITVSIDKKRYKKDELNSIFEKLFEKILVEAIGENEDYLNIKSDLNLKSYYGEGINAIWKFEPYEEDFESYIKKISIIEKDGRVNNEKLKNGEEVKGELILYFECEVSDSETIYSSDKYIIPVVVKEKKYNEKENFIKKLNEAIEYENKKDLNSNIVNLPNNVERKKIIYKEKFDMSIFMIPILGFIIILLLDYKDKYNIKKEEESIKRQLLLDYPKLITNTLLYIASGMSVRNTLLKISDNFLKYAGKDINVLSLYMEKLKLKLNSGVSEIESLEEISTNIDDRNYTRFFNILIQNIKNGSKDLKNILEIEMADAIYNRKMNARKTAEEAATKLILPLMMMFAIIMAVIIIPAFMNI